MCPGVRLEREKRNNTIMQAHEMSGKWRVDKHVKRFLGEWKCIPRERQQHEEILLQLILLKYFEVVNWIEATEYIEFMDGAL